MAAKKPAFIFPPAKVTKAPAVGKGVPKAPVFTKAPVKKGCK